jgi:hypothetical protein
MERVHGRHARRDAALLGNVNPIYHDALKVCVIYSTPPCGFSERR